jgi:hypothetical protein
MDDLVTFLRARLAATAARAEAARANAWYQAEDLERQGFESADALLIAREADPARVLREVEAKRGLLKEARSYAEAIEAEFGWQRDEIEAGAIRDGGNAGERMLRILALPYADHPDYRPEWAPTT